MIVTNLCPNRTDKYEGIPKYLVETEDTIELNKEHEESVQHHLQFEVSGPSSAAFASGPEGLVEDGRSSKRSRKTPASDESSDESSDDQVLDEQTSSSSDSDDGQSKGGSKRKGDATSNRPSKKKKPAEEVPEEYGRD